MSRRDWTLEHEGELANARLRLKQKEEEIGRLRLRIDELERERIPEDLLAEAGGVAQRPEYKR